jgi:putative tryptophan/tyrosine transport system substrate-binding protein
MTRREFITLLGGAASWPLAARAQQPKLPRIGVLVSASPPHPFADAFWRGLHALGYSEGQNIKVEFRYTDARSDRAEEFAEEFVRLNVDVIVAHFAIGTEAAMQATRTIPIVMAPHGAPLQLGVIDSLARPGGNVTGLSMMDAEIGANACSFSANSFRIFGASRLSARLQPQLRIANPSWRTCVWPSQVRASNLSQY